MAVRERDLSDPHRSVVLHQVDMDLTNDFYEGEWEAEPEAEVAAVLVEIVFGNAEVTVEAPAAEQMSRYGAVKLFVSRIGSGAKIISVKIATKTKATVRVTVAFLKKQGSAALRDLPCKVCKAVCRLLVRSALAHLGIPYLDALKTVKMPKPEIDMGLGHFPSFPDLSHLGVSSNETVDVLVGKPIELIQDVRTAITKLLFGNASGPLQDLFASVDLGLRKAIGVAFDTVNWFFDVTDKIYTEACRLVGCCPAAA